MNTLKTFAAIAIALGGLLFSSCQREVITESNTLTPQLEATGFVPGDGPCEPALVDFSDGFPPNSISDNTGPVYAFSASTSGFSYQSANGGCGAGCGVRIKFEAKDAQAINNNLAIKEVLIHSVGGSMEVPPQSFMWSPPFLHITLISPGTSNYTVEFQGNIPSQLRISDITPGMCVVDNLDIVDPNGFIPIQLMPDWLTNYLPPR